MRALPEHLRQLPTGRRKLEREVVQEHQRTRILETCTDLFATKGYPLTTVGDIIAAARIGVGSFYAHFSGKEECLLDAYDRAAGDVQELAVEAAANVESWPAQVCVGLRALLGWIAAEPAAANIALVQIQTGGSPALARYEASLDLLAGFLRRGREEVDSARRLPDSLERSTTSGIAWLLYHNVSHGETDSIGALFDDLAQMILEPYLREDGAKLAVSETALELSD